MSEKTFWSCSTVKELAQTFAEIVKQNYLSELNYWKAIARDSPDDYFMELDMRIKREPDVVKRNAEAKILKIMQNPQKYLKYYKRKWHFFRIKSIISITRASGFYGGLLNGMDIGYMAAINVEYLIDIKSLTIQKKIY